ncbi:hypothetical protein IP92_05434 [Pseudoduganella flava]|uniref:Uncharacterized protein n=1 Tax=Pseudoduganella flava TaxID=871742 RepID=A0A562PDH9_9BURK|nr:hypothetical protein [Pseudoduganella flava]QGZ42164.1 hypothetical protein GO485_26055 [Pseudoduganella flava]TWI42458.1 hypothetical protein IP92_05434 [Pseudoduganella flava]
MNFNHFPLICLLAVVATANADPVPAPLASMLQRGKSVIPASELSAEERAFLWQGTKLDPGGYLRMETSTAYVDLVNSFMSHPLFKKLSPPLVFAADGNESVTLEGVLPEDQFRSTSVFTWRGRRIAITSFDMKAAGARSVIAEEFLIRKVNGVPATLTLSVAKGTRDAMWKAGWLSDDVHYDVWVPEKLDANDGPGLAPDVVLDVSAALAGIVNKRR